MSQKIKLLKDHEHGGLKYKAGTTLDVEDHDATWLLENKVGEKSGSAPAPSLASPAASASDFTKQS